MSNCITRIFFMCYHTDLSVAECYRRFSNRYLAAWESNLEDKQLLKYTKYRSLYVSRSFKGKIRFAVDRMGGRARISHRFSITLKSQGTGTRITVFTTPWSTQLPFSAILVLVYLAILVSIGLQTTMPILLVLFGGATLELTMSWLAIPMFITSRRLFQAYLRDSLETYLSDTFSDGGVPDAHEEGKSLKHQEFLIEPSNSRHQELLYKLHSLRYRRKAISIAGAIF